MHCPECGTANELTHDFCQECGASLRDARALLAQAAPTQLRAAPPSHAEELALEVSLEPVAVPVVPPPPTSPVTGVAQAAEFAASPTPVSPPPPGPTCEPRPALAAVSQPLPSEAGQPADPRRIPPVNLQAVIRGTLCPLVIGFVAQGSGESADVPSAIAGAVAAAVGEAQYTVVDVGLSPEYAEYCRIRAVPTVLVLRHAKVIGRREGPVSQQEIADLLRTAAAVSAARPVASPAARRPETERRNAGLVATGTTIPPAAPADPTTQVAATASEAPPSTTSPSPSPAQPRSAPALAGRADAGSRSEGLECPGCGRANSRSAVFCVGCGTSLKEVATSLMQEMGASRTGKRAAQPGASVARSQATPSGTGAGPARQRRCPKCGSSDVDEFRQSTAQKLLGGVGVMALVAATKMIYDMLKCGRCGHVWREKK